MKSKPIVSGSRNDTEGFNGRKRYDSEQKRYVEALRTFADVVAIRNHAWNSASDSGDLVNVLNRIG